MKKLITAILIAPLLFLASCGGSEADLIGKWNFSDVTFPNGAPKDATPERIAEMKDMFKTMSYEFTDKTHFTFTSPMMEKPTKGTYKMNGKDLAMTVEGKTEHFMVNELSSSKLVLEMQEKGMKKEDRFELVFAK